MDAAEARARVEEVVFVVCDEESIMSRCDALGFKYKKTPRGKFSAGERSRCELFLIETYTNELMNRG